MSYYYLLEHSLIKLKKVNFPASRENKERGFT